MYRIRFILTLMALCLINSVWADIPTLRAGVLKFGTVNWELQTIKKYKLDIAEGFNLEVVPYAGKLATTTALHGGAVDTIVNDWIWVSRQRSEGRAYGFIPYSRINGALMVSTSSGIKTLADLKGMKVGIAGGPVDKSWLIIQAIARKRYDIDISKSIDLVYGAPPLLTKKMESGELDAVITFWHYAARLESADFSRLIDIKDALAELGMKGDVPMIGYVFSPELTQARSPLIQALARASRKAKTVLASKPNAWDAVKPMMKAKSKESYQALKLGFLQGIPTRWGDEERNQAKNLFRLLAILGGKKLVGKSTELDQGTFINDVRY